MTKKIIWKFLSEKIRNLPSICLEKSKFFVNLPGKIEIFLPGSTTPRFQTRLTPLLPCAEVSPTRPLTAEIRVVNLLEIDYTITRPVLTIFPLVFHDYSAPLLCRTRTLGQSFCDHVDSLCSADDGYRRSVPQRQRTQNSIDPPSDNIAQYLLFRCCLG